MYQSLLTKLGIDGKNESENFRSFLEFLNDYFEAYPEVTKEAFTNNEPTSTPGLATFDLVLRTLVEHEKSLTNIVKRFEEIQPVTM